MSEPEAILRRAQSLDRTGENDAAKVAYLEYLTHRPDDVEALIALGNLAFRTGYRSAAKTAYRRAIELDPRNLSARVNFANALLGSAEHEAAAHEYRAALVVDPAFAPAHQGLSYALTRLGQEGDARHHRDLGFSREWMLRIPYRGSGTPIRVLLFVSAAGGNFNTEWLLDPATYDVVRIAAEYAGAGAAVPAHDVAVNAIGDAELCGAALRKAAALAQRLPTAMVNPPDRVLQTTRVAVAARLRDLSSAVVPEMAVISRTVLETNGSQELSSRGFRFPVLLRTPGHHTGRNFVRVEDSSALASAVAALPGEELLAISFLDARDPDGLIRKYRVLIVGGKILPVHCAVSREWKIHHFSADAGDNERAADARFLRDPRGVIGEAGYETLGLIGRALGLDYGGIDFSVGRDGRIMVFEANATMSVVPAGSDERWAYRRPVLAGVREAFRAMLAARAAVTHG